MASHPSRKTGHRQKPEPRKPAGEKSYSGARRAEATPADTDMNGSWAPAPSPRVDADDKRALRPLSDDGWVRAYHAERDRLNGQDPEIG